MTNRRDFLTSLVAASGSAPLFRARRAAPRVEATATVFYAHPAGETTLVRFAVHDADAPAGRLRVFDGRGRDLLGTAGVLGMGGSLFGELWLPLRGETRIVSQLEMPGLARPLRTPHVLDPQPRWTIHWIAVVDPDQLIAHLGGLPDWRRYAGVATLQSLNVFGNPFPPGRSSPDTMDHVTFLRRAHASRRLERDFGIQMGSVGVGHARDLRMRASALALNGSGVQHAVLLDDNASSVFGTLRGRDGSAVAAASVPPRSSVDALRFPEGGDPMAREVERWLTETPAFIAPSYGTTVALAVQTRVDDRLGHIAQAVTDWNSRYAFPHITIGTPENYFGEVARVTAPRPAALMASESAQHHPAPSTSQIEQVRTDREAQRRSHVQNLVAPLNALLQSEVSGVGGIAQHLDARLDGTLVLNPSPIPRTDLVAMPDGSEHVATDIPAIGYAYILGRSSSAPEPFVQLGPHSLFGQFLTVRLDPETGSMNSLYDRASEREWVRTGTPGLNAVRSATLERVTRLRLPEIGMRLIAERRTEIGRLTTTITGYESLPWIDITNDYQSESGQDVQYDHHFHVDEPRVTWETPAGFEEATLPMGPVAHLRWLRLQTRDEWQVLFRGIDAPYAACDDNGRVVSLAPTGRTRFRIKLASPYAPPDEPWHFGWSTEPFVVQPVSAASARGTTLPRFGSLLTVDDPGVAVLGIKQADNEDGAVVYVQELLGVARNVKLAAGLLGFLGARRVDLIERHLDVLDVTAEPAVALPLPAHGVVAVRLIDLFVQGT